VVFSRIKASMFPTAALSTSGIRVEGFSFLSACYNKLPCIFSCKQKQETPCSVPPVKSSAYHFLRRHYPHPVKGSKFTYFLSARLTSSPVFVYIMIVLLFSAKRKSSIIIYNIDRKYFSISAPLIILFTFTQNRQPLQILCSNNTIGRPFRFAILLRMPHRRHSLFLVVG